MTLEPLTNLWKTCHINKKIHAFNADERNKNSDTYVLLLIVKLTIFSRTKSGSKFRDHTVLL